MKNPHDITRDFEKALCEYTGAPFAVAVNSCTAALTLAVAYQLRWPNEGGEKYIDPRIEIPKRTYVGVPYAIREADARVAFRDEDWRGAYQLKPLPVWDSARWFTGGIYEKLGGMVAVSFHNTKTLGDSQGGAILHDSAQADRWLRRARFDGRTEGVPPARDRFDMPRAWHCYLSPDVAARLLWHLNSLPEHNEPLPNDDYPDLSQAEAFK